MKDSKLQVVLDWWNEIAEVAGLPKARGLTAERRRKIAIRVKEEAWQDLDALKKAILSNDWFCRRNLSERDTHPKWRPKIDYLIRNDGIAVGLLEEHDAPTIPGRPASAADRCRLLAGGK